MEEASFIPIPDAKIFRAPRSNREDLSTIARLPYFIIENIRTFLCTAACLYRNRKYFEIVHCFTANWLSLYAILIAGFLGKKTILEMTLLGGDDPSAIPRHDILKIKHTFTRWIFRKADIVVSISPALSSAYKSVGLPVEKLREVANPVDTNCYRPMTEDERNDVRNKLRIPAGKHPVILFVGSVVRRKGVDFLAKVFLKIVEIYPKALLLLVGPNDRNSEEIRLTNWIREITRKAGSENQVVFTGQVNNVNEYMKASDLFVFTSRREGFGTVVVEAMATGLPVIALKIPGITDYIIDDDKDGLIIEDEDAGKFSAAVDKLLRDRTFYKHISKHARETARTRFSIENIDAQYDGVYNAL